MAGARFEVEHAGCPSCAARIRGALEAIATVEVIEIDERADTAAVRLADSSRVLEEAVALALQKASAGSGHEYRVQPGSWVDALP
ncbi:MAG: heavy-metal-associated domain-containing protein [Actinomycetota bacterium]|nr:heavy-metal-associated domain-containing protein [Actinomycetota bacterium]